jgi:hypothetical protein
MDSEGPLLEQLLHHLAETPDDFLAAPRIGAGGRVVVAAVISDLARAFHLELSPGELARFDGNDPKRDTARLSVALLLCWVLHSDGFAGRTLTRAALQELLGDTAAALAQHASPRTYVHDPDRREELARLALAAFGLRPAGESKAQAADRLAGISGVERARVLKASRAAEERARAIREALARKAAEESADKWTRE